MSQHFRNGYIIGEFLAWVIRGFGIGIGIALGLWLTGVA